GVLHVRRGRRDVRAHCEGGREDDGRPRGEGLPRGASATRERVARIRLSQVQKSLLALPAPRARALPAGVLLPLRAARARARCARTRRRHEDAAQSFAVDGAARAVASEGEARRFRLRARVVRARFARTSRRKGSFEMTTQAAAKSNPIRDSLRRAAYAF